MPLIGPNTIKEAVDTTLGGSAGYSDPDEHLWRSINPHRHADLNPVTQEKMQRVALLLYRINPLANRIMNLTTSFVASGNINIMAADPDIQKLLNDHWIHPVNDWDNKLYQRVFELGMYGELCLPAKAYSDGKVLLGYVSPLEIEEVLPLKRDNSLAGTVVLKTLPGELKAKKLEVIQYVLDNRRRDNGFRSGEAFFFTTNRVLDSMRGASDLLPLSDYLDALDQLLFNLLERMGHLNSYIWDVKLTGANKEKINEFLADVQSKPPRPGGVRAHNEMVEWTSVSPNLQSEDNSEHVRLYRNHILGGAGLPEWMYAESGSSGRASASEQAEPTYKTLMARQKEVKSLLSHIFNFIIDHNIRIKNLKPNVNREFVINLPKISLRDFQRTSGALYRSTQALELLLKNNLIDEEKAQRLANGLLDQLDLGEEAGVASSEVKKIDNPQSHINDWHFAVQDYGSPNSNSTPASVDPNNAPKPTNPSTSKVATNGKK